MTWLFWLILKLAGAVLGFGFIALIAFGCWGVHEFYKWVDRGGRQTID